MWTSYSTCSRLKALSAAAVLLAASVTPARAQLTVYDPTNLVQNALQAARQLESLTHEAQMLINQARELAASPYSHLIEASQTLKSIGQLARDVRGLAASVQDLEVQFRELYPTAVEGLDPRRAVDQAQRRTRLAAATAEDLARAAAELEQLSSGRDQRIRGALSASEGATGQTAAIQSSTQMLAVMAEDLATLRTALLAQSRLMAEAAAREAAERAAGAEARRQYYAREAVSPAAPVFEPFARARN